MAFEVKELSGALFRNDKGSNPARPDMRGNIRIDGVLYDLSAWKRTPKAGGEAYLSLAAQVHEERGAAATTSAHPAEQPASEPREELPF